MSETHAEAVELPRGDDAAFAALMDVLAPEEGAGETATTETSETATDGASGADAASAAAAGTAEAGSAGTASAGGGATGEAAAATTAADTGQRTDDAGSDGTAPAGVNGGDATAAGGATGGTGAGAADAPLISAAQLGELSTALEERVTQAYQATALEEVQTEHKAYFDALEQHPRMLAGQTVPAIGREGTEVLRDTADAREWQDAVKQLLASEVRSRASKAMDENKDFLTTVHSSISLFQDNPDLIPGAAAFDKELAERLVQLVEPYELRVEGKLQGYTIPVQPIVNQLRAKVAQERAAATTTAAAAGEAPSTTAPAATTTTKKTEKSAAAADPPQAGITSKAGAGGDGTEDFSTLFGTIGLPGLRI